MAWDVQQSLNIHNATIRNGEWFSLSQKINGVRGTYYNGEIISRSGKAIYGINHIINDISKLPFNANEYVFDGELIRKNIDNISDNENFRIGTGIINSNSEKKYEICFVIFDLIPTEEFDSGQSSLTYKARKKQLLELKRYIEDHNISNINIVDMLYDGTDQSEINKYLDIMLKDGKEGLILNRDNKYYRRRNSGILKIKKFYNIDLQVIGFQEGTGRLQNKLGAFIVNYKGNKLYVGSGMTDEERTLFWNNRNALISRIIEIQYKDETADKKTKNKSLQFPIFITLREIGKEISYS